MRIQTGQTITARIPLRVEYTCSACHKRTSDIVNLESSAGTGVIMGIPLDRDLHSKASAGLMEQLDKLSKIKHPRQLQDYDLPCACEHCGHQEPWARLYPKWTRKAFIACLIPLIFIAIAFLNMAVKTDWSGTHWVTMILLVILLGCSIGIKLYEHLNKQDMLAQLDKLPKESLPQFSVGR